MIPSKKEKKKKKTHLPNTTNTLPSPPPPPLHITHLPPLQIIIFLFITHRGTYKLSSMEGIAFCNRNNKENIPPFSTKRTNPVPANALSSKKTNKRRLRKPLADITNLFYDSVQPSSVPESVYLLLSSSASSVSVSNPRKRRAILKTGSVQVATSNSKSLRMGFR